MQVYHLQCASTCKRDICYSQQLVFRLHTPFKGATKTKYKYKYKLVLCLHTPLKGQRPKLAYNVNKMKKKEI